MRYDLNSNTDASGQTMGRFEIASLIKQADSIYFSGRFNEAEAHYQEVLKQQPNHSHALRQRGLMALWRNDLQTAERCFLAAQKNSKRLDRYWPFSAQSLYYLALLYRRAGRVEEAGKLFCKAAGLLPLGALKELKVRGRQLALFSDTNFCRIRGAVQTRVPLISVDPLPLVAVNVNATAPTVFFIDTGADDVILDRKFAEHVNAVVVGEFSGEYAGGKRGKTQVGAVDQLRLGDLELENVPVSILDLEPTSRLVFSGQAIGGIIGTGFLQHFLSTLDYANHALILRQQPPSRFEVDTLLNLSANSRCFPIWLVHTHLIFTMGSVNGLETGQMLIDTGLASAGFMASKSVFAEAGVELDWRKAAVGAGGGGEVKGVNAIVHDVALGQGEDVFHQYDLQGVATEVDNAIFKGSLGFEVKGLISHQFFREYALTFDFQNMRMIIQ